MPLKKSLRANYKPQVQLKTDDVPQTFNVCLAITPLRRFWPRYRKRLGNSRHLKEFTNAKLNDSSSLMKNSSRYFQLH